MAATLAPAIEPAVIEIGGRHDSPELPLSGSTGAQEPCLEVIEAMRRGDRAAFAALYDRTRTLVYGLALRILRDSADAEEITVDVYAQLWRNAVRFDPRRGGLRAQLVTMTRSRSIERLRSGAHRQRLRETSEPLENAMNSASAVSPEKQVLVSERQESVRAALAALPNDQRRALELAFFEGLTHSELAAHLGLPLGTVKSHIRSGMIRLRKQLAALA